jgi:hypothetical protein
MAQGGWVLRVACPVACPVHGVLRVACAVGCGGPLPRGNGCRVNRRAAIGIQWLPRQLGFPPVACGVSPSVLYPNGILCTLTAHFLVWPVGRLRFDVSTPLWTRAFIGG